MVAAKGGVLLGGDRARHFMTGLYERFGLPFGSAKGGHAVSMRCRRLLLDEAVCGGKREDRRVGKVSSEPDRRQDCRDTTLLLLVRSS